MFRAGLLWLSEQPRVFRFVRHNGVAKRFAARFVAGESVDSAVSVARDLNAIGLSTSLDLLGESVSRSEEAQHARDSYVDLLEHIRAAGVDANVSVKLTQLGLDIDETLGHGHIAAIVDRARALGNFVRVDMEGSAYTERTLRLFSDRLLPDFGRDHVGWRRRGDDRPRRPRPVVQGRLPGAGGRRVPGQARRRRELRVVPRASAREGALPGHRDP
jgi:proline dehydrogenase